MKTQLDQIMAEHNIATNDLGINVISAEGASRDGWKTYTARGFFLYSTIDGAWRATILWGVDKYNRLIEGEPAVTVAG